MQERKIFRGEPEHLFVADLEVYRSAVDAADEHRDGLPVARNDDHVWAENRIGRAHNSRIKIEIAVRMLLQCDPFIFYAREIPKIAEDLNSERNIFLLRRRCCAGFAYRLFG